MDNKRKKFDFTPIDNQFIAPVASSEIVYYNSEHQEVSKEEGCYTKITEFDVNGNIIREVWGSYTNEPSLKTR